MRSRKVKRLWIFGLLMTLVVCVQFMLIPANSAIAQFYFPMTSGASHFYNYSTLRYGNLYGLSAMTPFEVGLGFNAIFGGFWGWNNLGIMWPFGGLYGGIRPLGPYLWPYR